MLTPLGTSTLSDAIPTIVRPAAQSPTGSAAPAPAPAPAPVPTEPGAEEPAEPAAPKRLLEKLASGHFRGVADLRLRLNFAEELGDTPLPPPSAPNGRGRAFEKFLEAYRSAQHPPATPLDPAA